jgi:hypothetical protein
MPQTIDAPAQRVAATAGTALPIIDAQVATATMRVSGGPRGADEDRQLTLVADGLSLVIDPLLGDPAAPALRRSRGTDGRFPHPHSGALVAILASVAAIVWYA